MDELTGQWQQATEDRLYLRERVDHISDILSRNTVILEQNTESLKEHMQQTRLIERRVRMLEETRKFGKWLVYLIGLITTVGGAILVVKQLFGR